MYSGVGVDVDNSKVKEKGFRGILQIEGRFKMEMREKKPCQNKSHRYTLKKKD